jgi:hypothetical protein
MFVFETAVLSENGRLGRRLTARGVRVEWCSHGTLRSGHRYPLTREVLVAGSVQFVHTALRALEVPVPAPLGFPVPLAPWFGRSIVRCTVSDAVDLFDERVLFVKPADELKAFTGGLSDDPEVRDGLRRLGPARSVWVADPVTFVAEWRCFVVGGQVVAVAQYVPDIDVVLPAPPDRALLDELCAAAFEATGLAGFSVDVGRTDDGRVLLVELNDGYALGSYDIDDDIYFDVLWARWRQLMHRSAADGT